MIPSTWEFFLVFEWNVFILRLFTILIWQWIQKRAFLLMKKEEETKQNKTNDEALKLLTSLTTDSNWRRNLNILNETHTSVLREDDTLPQNVYIFVEYNNHKHRTLSLIMPHLKSRLCKHAWQSARIYQHFNRCFALFILLAREREGEIAG